MTAAGRCRSVGTRDQVFEARLQQWSYNRLFVESSSSYFGVQESSEQVQTDVMSITESKR